MQTFALVLWISGGLLWIVSYAIACVACFLLDTKNPPKWATKKVVIDAVFCACDSGKWLLFCGVLMYLIDLVGNIK